MRHTVAHWAIPPFFIHSSFGYDIPILRVVGHSILAAQIKKYQARFSPNPWLGQQEKRSANHPKY